MQKLLATEKEQKDDQKEIESKPKAEEDIISVLISKFKYADNKKTKISQREARKFIDDLGFEAFYEERGYRNTPNFYEFQQKDFDKYDNIRFENPQQSVYYVIGRKKNQ